MRRLFDRVFSGNDEMYAKAAHDLDEAIAKFGADHVMKFPDTAYNCAIILRLCNILLIFSHGKILLFLITPTTAWYFFCIISIFPG